MRRDPPPVGAAVGPAVAVDVNRDDCATCIRLKAAARDALTRLHHAMDDEQATRRAYEDHEASTHRIQPPRRWEPAPAVAVTWSSPEGVSYTFAPAPEGTR